MFQDTPANKVDKKTLCAPSLVQWLVTSFHNATERAFFRNYILPGTTSHSAHVLSDIDFRNLDEDGMSCETVQSN